MYLNIRLEYTGIFEDHTLPLCAIILHSYMVTLYYTNASLMICICYKSGVL